jgi:hypothetical protein
MMRTFFTIGVVLWLRRLGRHSRQSGEAHSTSKEAAFFEKKNQNTLISQD